MRKNPQSIKRWYPHPVLSRNTRPIALLRLGWESWFIGWVDSDMGLSYKAGYYCARFLYPRSFWTREGGKS